MYKVSLPTGFLGPTPPLEVPLHEVFDFFLPTCFLSSSDSFDENEGESESDSDENEEMT